MKKIKKIFYTICAALGILLATAIYLLYRDHTPPVISLSPNHELVSAQTVFTLNIKDNLSLLKDYKIELVTNNTTTQITPTTLKEKTNTLNTTFTLEQYAQKDGEAKLHISATDNSYAKFGNGNKITKTFTFQLDATKPAINVLAKGHSLIIGGANLVIYDLSEEVKNTGIEAAGVFFQAYPQPNGKYFCLITMPHNITAENFKNFKAEITAADLAGNVAQHQLDIRIIDPGFKPDIIKISDNFLNSKMKQFQNDFPNATSQLERFLLVNRQLRDKNRNQMKLLATRTSSVPLFDKQRFLRLPRAVSRANFGDRRSYIYKKNKIDEQIHLGIDLASTRHAPIPAANNGNVVHAGTFGIYGKSVVIDHGLGLMSLYSHMSKLDVKTGDSVKKGKIIGLTGATGMAGGDHLHFAIWINGIPAQPLQWWDKRWIKFNITDSINDPEQ